LLGPRVGGSAREKPTRRSTRPNGDGRPCGARREGCSPRGRSGPAWSIPSTRSRTDSTRWRQGRSPTRPRSSPPSALTNGMASSPRWSGRWVHERSSVAVAGTVSRSAPTWPRATTPRRDLLDRLRPAALSWAAEQPSSWGMAAVGRSPVETLVAYATAAPARLACALDGCSHPVTRANAACCTRPERAPHLGRTEAAPASAPERRRPIMRRRQEMTPSRDDAVK
jgi:hypothetical protein